MRSSELRRKAAALADFNAYICLAGHDRSGVLVAVKDNIDVAGMVTTAGGRHLPAEPASRDAPVVAAIRAAGGHVAGKANLHEYAFGVTNDNVHFGPARNPCDPARIPGGSSGGSAVAVRLGLCDWAVGTDTGGSIRIPAALCGVVGMKPTYGTVSTEGIFPLAESLDVPGPMARDVRTAALGLEMMTGRSGLDPGAAGDWNPDLAVPRGWSDGLDPTTRKAWEAVTAGLPVIDFPAYKPIEDAFQPVLFAEATSYHLDWLRDRPAEYSEDVRSTLELGRKVTGAGYLWALRQRDRLRAEVEAALAGHDAVLVPTTTIVAPRFGTPHVREPLLRYVRPFSFTGHPVVTVPAPTDGLPVGVQVVGHHGADADLLRVAAALQARWGTGEPP